MATQDIHANVTTSGGSDSGATGAAQKSAGTAPVAGTTTVTGGSARASRPRPGGRPPSPTWWS